ncbi:MAG: efflux RND transporter periplasmic adaptor subunit [Pseudomonadota bacterium]
MKLNKKILAIIIIGLIVSGFFGFKFFKKESLNYITHPITKGTLVKQIQASGTINPVNIIDVGTQVSAIINKIYVNYNDQVKEGQILAQLDTSLLENQVGIDKGSLDKTKASRDLAKLTRDRNKDLFISGYIAKAQLDQAETDFKSANADYASALAQYKKSVRNLNLATIKSPVSGVVVDREVQEGQTVAASLQAPSLFKIAKDLTKMQIETAISEADISQIKNDQVVNFTVDAYQDLNFQGVVNQIRLNPTSDQNVVTYTVIVNIDNSDLKLLPGMTAFINILIDKKDDVLKVPNAVFNFKNKEHFKDKENSTQLHLEKDQAIIYLLDANNKISAIKVNKGLSNELETQIISDKIKEGDKIIEDVLTQKSPTPKKSNPRPNF